MNNSLPKIKIYMPVIDELRPVESDEARKAWEARMHNACAQRDFKSTKDMHLLDTCCGGAADDCGMTL